MTNKAHMAEVMNARLGGFLVESRSQARTTVRRISQTTGLSENRILEIEERPAQVPMCELARVISFYGSDRTMEAQCLIAEVQFEASKLHQPSASRSRFRKLTDSSQTKLFARKVIAFAAGYFLWEAIKQTYRSLFAARIG
jgi:hypothetical protein